MEKFFTLKIISTADVCHKCICFFSEIVTVMINGNMTLFRSTHDKQIGLPPRAHPIL